jgi:hypothetical protein
MQAFLDGATVLELKDVIASEAFCRQKPGFRQGNFFGGPIGQILNKG